MIRSKFRGGASPLGELGAPVVDFADVERLRPDLIVVASFPTLIPAGTIAAANVGSLNVHMSLLPRHRGVDPIFWTYWDDDRAAGVTVHWMDSRLDSGDIAAQESLAFERGFASRDLYMQLAHLGVELLSGVLKDVSSGCALRQPQGEAGATYESAADISGARIPAAQWPAERVWHVVRGLGDQRSGLLAEHEGKFLPHGRAIRYRVTDDTHPGRVAIVNEGYEVHCQDGIVTVERLGHAK